VPFPSVHYLLAFGGTLYGVEEWSCTLRSTSVGADPGQEGTASITAALAAVIKTWWATGQVGANGTLDYVKYNRVGMDGKYVNTYSSTFEVAPPIPGNGASEPRAPQIAIVATLETGFTRGLAHRGRIFLPTPSAGPGSDGRIAASNASNLAQKVASLITALNGVEGYGTTCVYSSVVGGANRPVTAVTVGRTLDTMRSRRRSLPEERPVAAPVTGQ